MARKVVVGLDLGTCCSVVSVYRNGRTEVISNEQGNRTTPSVVAFTDTEILVGESAKNQSAMNPKNTIYEVKRLMGRKFSDKEVQSDMKIFHYDVIDDGKDI